MTETEKLEIRVKIAMAARVSTNDIEMDCNGVVGIYSVNINGHDLMLGYHDRLTVGDFREEIKKLYLSAVELDFDNGVTATR